MQETNERRSKEDRGRDPKTLGDMLLEDPDEARRGKVMMDILAAHPDELHATLERLGSEVTEGIVEMLDNRIMYARQLGEVRGTALAHLCAAC